MDNDLTACRDSLSIETNGRRAAELELKECKDSKIEIRRKTLISSVKRTVTDILIGIAIGAISLTLF